MDDPFVFSPQWKLARLQNVERRGVRGWVMIVKSSPSVPNTRKHGDDPLHFIVHITEAKLSKHCKLLLKLFSISSFWRVYFKQIRDKFRVKSLSVDCRDFVERTELKKSLMATKKQLVVDVNKKQRNLILILHLLQSYFIYFRYKILYFILIIFSNL